MNRTTHLHGFLRRVVTAAVLAVGGSNAWSGPGNGAQPQRCPDGGAAVIGAGAADFADVCQGVSRSLKFLALHGVQAAEPVSIEVTHDMPEEAGPTAAGCYLEQKRRVFVVPYSAFHKNKTWFGVSINRELYRALAAHEAAHAVAACNFRIPRPAIQAKEYLAYVAMFSVMPADLRAQALRATQTEGFTSLDRFTPLLYMFDPMRFGAEAYRHFSSVPDQAALIQEVLSGKVLTD